MVHIRRRVRPGQTHLTDTSRSDPPQTFVGYLNRADVQKKIGAKAGTKFQFCSNKAGAGFTANGDGARSFLPTLSRVVQSGIQVLIWAGDADFICNVSAPSLLICADY